MGLYDTYYPMKLPRNLTMNQLLVGAGIAALVAFSLALRWLLGDGTTTFQRPTIGPDTTEQASKCATADQRPVAIMLASDPEARPLSGIASANMVFEMPVTPNGITRMMGVFWCHQPKEIGSVRSARQDFIPLAQGLGAILAHWGGEQDALALLKSKVIDNIDGLIYDGSVYWRKSSVPRPHNGFTSIESVLTQSTKLGYTTTRQPESPPQPTHSSSEGLEVRIAWPQGMGVTFQFDPTTSTYLRWRGGTPEIDRLTGSQVSASAVVVLETESSFVRDQYIRVRTTGTGVATIYQQGTELRALWHKATATSPLTFTDPSGKAIALAPGLQWFILNPPLPDVH